MTTPPVALTMGDPAGVGGEIAALAWERRAVDAPFFMIADADWMASFGAPVKRIDRVEDAVFADALPVLHRPLPRTSTPGASTPENAAATIASIEESVALTMQGRASAVVTNPINKKALYDGAAFAFPGHTEYLAHLCGAKRSVMMLAGPELRVVPVTIHIALEEVPGTLNGELILETIRILAAALRTDFGLPAPRIAVAGLNPHAGEGGAMGRQEVEVITPALDMLRAEGLDVTGPHSADTMFHAAARARYDAAVCMYHDQALIPIKTLDFERGVNVTLGLPIIRTSPDHGTAYDIAGKGLADPTSLIEAIAMAHRMARHRAGA